QEQAARDDRGDEVKGRTPQRDRQAEQGRPGALQRVLAAHATDRAGALVRGAGGVEHAKLEDGEVDADAGSTQAEQQGGASAEARDRGGLVVGWRGHVPWRYFVGVDSGSRAKLARPEE